MSFGSTPARRARSSSVKVSRLQHTRAWAGALCSVFYVWCFERGGRALLILMNCANGVIMWQFEITAIMPATNGVLDSVFGTVIKCQW